MTELPAWTEPPPRWDCEDEACTEEVRRLRVALADAIKGMQRMLPYVNDYRREEHRLDVYLQRAQVAYYEGLEPTWENTRMLQDAQDQLDRMQRRLS